MEAFWAGFAKEASSRGTARVDRMLQKLMKSKDKSQLSKVHKMVFSNDTLKRHRLGKVKNRATEHAAATQAKGGFRGTDL